MQFILNAAADQAAIVPDSFWLSPSPRIAAPNRSRVAPFLAAAVADDLELTGSAAVSVVVPAVVLLVNIAAGFFTGRDLMRKTGTSPGSDGEGRR